MKIVGCPICGTSAVEKMSESCSLKVHHIGSSSASRLTWPNDVNLRHMVLGILVFKVLL